MKLFFFVGVTVGCQWRPLVAVHGNGSQVRFTCRTGWPVCRLKAVSAPRAASTWNYCNLQSDPEDAEAAAMSSLERCTAELLNPPVRPVTAGRRPGSNTGLIYAVKTELPCKEGQIQSAADRTPRPRKFSTQSSACGFNRSLTNWGAPLCSGSLALLGQLGEGATGDFLERGRTVWDQT